MLFTQNPFESEMKKKLNGSGNHHQQQPTMISNKVVSCYHQHQLYEKYLFIYILWNEECTSKLKNYFFFYILMAFHLFLYNSLTNKIKPLSVTLRHHHHHLIQSSFKFSNSTVNNVVWCIVCRDHPFL